MRALRTRVIWEICLHLVACRTIFAAERLIADRVLQNLFATLAQNQRRYLVPAFLSDLCWSALYSFLLRHSDAFGPNILHLSQWKRGTLETAAVQGERAENENWSRYLLILVIYDEKTAITDRFNDIRHITNVFFPDLALKVASGLSGFEELSVSVILSLWSAACVFRCQ